MIHWFRNTFFSATSGVFKDKATLNENDSFVPEHILLPDPVGCSRTMQLSMKMTHLFRNKFISPEQIVSSQQSLVCLFPNKNKATLNEQMMMFRFTFFWAVGCSVANHFFSTIAGLFRNIITLNELMMMFRNTFFSTTSGMFQEQWKNDSFVPEQIRLTRTNSFFSTIAGLSANGMFRNKATRNGYVWFICSGTNRFQQSVGWSGTK